MKTLKHHGDDVNAVNPNTKAVRYSDKRVATLFPTTQAWSWDDGDALVGVGPNGASWVVLRLQNHTHVETDVKGLNDALRRHGLDLKDFVLQ